MPRESPTKKIYFQPLQLHYPYWTKWKIAVVCNRAMSSYFIHIPLIVVVVCWFGRFLGKKLNGHTTHPSVVFQMWNMRVFIVFILVSNWTVGIQATTTTTTTLMVVTAETMKKKYKGKNVESPPQWWTVANGSTHLVCHHKKPEMRKQMLDIYSWFSVVGSFYVLCIFIFRFETESSGN